MSQKHSFDEPVILKTNVIHSFPIFLNGFRCCLMTSGKCGLKKKRPTKRHNLSVLGTTNLDTIASHATRVHLERTPHGIHNISPIHSSTFPRQLYENPGILQPEGQKYKVSLHLLAHGLSIFVMDLYVKLLSLSPKIASSHHKHYHSVKRRKKP